MEKTVKKKISRVQELIEQMNSTTDAALKDALGQLVEKEKKAEATRLLADFERATDILNDAVASLVQVRKLEKSAKNKVTTLDDAFEAFKATGNFEAFRASCMTVGIGLIN